MKIGERHWDDEGRLIVQETHDFNPVLDSARVLRDQRDLGGPQIADGKHVARIPMKLVEIEAEKRGIDWSDQEAMNQLVQDMVMNTEFSQFRVWDGRPW